MALSANLGGLADLDFTKLAAQAPSKPKTNFSSDLFDSARGQTFTPTPQEFAPAPKPAPKITPIAWPKSTPSTPSYTPPSYTPPPTITRYNPPAVYQPPTSYTPPRIPWLNPDNPSAPSPTIPVYNPAPAPKPSAPAPVAQPQPQTPDITSIAQQMALMVAPQQSVVIGGSNAQPLPFQADRSFRGKDPGIANQRRGNYLDLIRAGFSGGG